MNELINTKEIMSQIYYIRGVKVMPRSSGFLIWIVQGIIRTVLIGDFKSPMNVLSD
jgi:hypothetical protein